jgi:ATP-dependent Clp protease ATP-binding subunit ClpB
LPRKMAEERNHPQFETEHLLLALVDQKDGVVPQILDKLGVDQNQLKRQLENELGKLAKASGPTQVYLSPRLKQMLDAAEKESHNFKDEYTSTEHLLIAIIDQDPGAAGRILKGYGITRDRVYQILASIRGNQRVTDPNPEGKYQALEKYGRDLDRDCPPRKTRPCDRAR